jgi:antirestriction protein
MSELKIYAACLASYNNGRLHGRWIEATADSDSMQDEINAMLRESPFPNVRVTCAHCDGRGEKTFHNSETGDTRQGPCPTCNGAKTVPSAEEYAIHDYEGLPRSFGEYAGIQRVAEFAALCDEFAGSLESDDLAEIVDSVSGDIGEAREKLNDRFAGIYESFRDYADESADSQIECFAPAGRDASARAGFEFLQRYFDYESYARDLEMESDTVELSGGRVAVFYY